jgi:outer membrane biosynthesis protein TonB
MPDLLPRMPPKGPLTPERRQNPRHPVRPTEYIEIGDSNGGIILDISEGGMAVASAHALVGNQTLLFRFQLPRSNEIIEASGKINWIGETKKRAGVRFVDLPPATREQIQKWIDSETLGRFNGDQKPNISAVPSSPKIPQEFPRHGSVHRELTHEESTTSRGHDFSKNLNPFSSALSGPLDEPEIDESEPTDEVNSTADSNAQPPPERRAQTRLPVTASTYVQLSDGNGGLMANLSKTGFCVRAAKTLEADELPVVRFQLPDASDFVESSAWIVWKSPSKKMAGARFESLSDEAQSQIAQWIDSQPLPKNAPIKNPLSKNRPDPPASNPSEQRQKPAASVTLMSPDSVPIPAYISPLAVSPNAQPSTRSANNSSSAPPRAKLPPITSASKPSPPSTAKTPAQIPPPIIPPPLYAKPPIQSQRPLPASASKPVTPASSHVSRDLKNPWDQFATAPTPTAPFVSSASVLPAVFNEPDWSVAPKRPTGYWKIAAMIVVIVGTLLGAATLLRSKKSTTPVSQESAQNSSAAATVPTETSSTDAPANSAMTNSAPINQPTPSSTAARSNSASLREFSDAPRNPSASKSEPKGDEQFVDEPRPPRSQPQISIPPIQSNISSSPTASEQPSASRPAPIQSDDERPTEEGSGFPTAVRRVQTSPPPASSNANDERASAPASTLPPPAPAASRDLQAGSNLASAAGVPQNSLSTATTTTTSQAASSASIPNPVPSVSVFSRFRAIRRTSDAARPVGSDLQIGRLKSGPAPPYPIEAQRQQIQGTVELDVLVGADGSILTVHLVKGPPELASVAMGTVRSWQYGQTTLGGHPVETDQSIYFTFKLTK